MHEHQINRREMHNRASPDVTDDARRLIELETDFKAFKTLHNEKMKEFEVVKKKVTTAEHYGRGAILAFGMTIAVVSQFSNVVKFIKGL